MKFLTFPLAVFLAAMNSLAYAGDPRLEQLLKLPVELSEFRAAPFITVACALQAVGKEKAKAVLMELAAQDKLPYTRTVVLARMLFKPKSGSSFRMAYIGDPGDFGGKRIKEWSLAPIAVIDGVPFLLVRGYNLAGPAEPATEYLDYCFRECEWNDFGYKGKSKKQMEEGLQKLLTKAGLKGRISEDEREHLEAQIK